MAGFMPDAVAAPFSSAGDGTTALHLAASSGHANCVALLLQWAARPHAVDAMGCSPLDCAVMNGHFAAALPLLAAGCTLRCAELLDAAAEEEDKAESASPQSKPTAAVEEARLAESEGSDYTSDSDANGELEQTAEGAGGTPPRRPPPPPLPDRVHRILSVLGNTTPQSTHPDVGALSPSESLYRDFFNTDVSVFAAAASGGLVPTLRYFIEHSTSEHGTPICPDLDQALLLAVRGNHTATVRFLLDECGCTPEASEHHALVHHAAALGHIEVLSLLINAGWDATKTHAGTTALHEAVIYGHTGFVEALLDIPGMDALVDHSDRNGWTALHYAAASGMTSAIKCLLEHGARVDIPLPNGMTAAHLAAQKEFDDALYMLLDAGADLGAVDGQSWLPLHYVAQRGDLANFILLYPGTARHLTAGPQGAANAQGATLLTAAVQGLSPEMVGALLRSTPGLKQACAAAGETPVHAAAREGSIYALYFLWESVCGMFDMAAADEEGRTPLHHVPTGYGHAKTKAIAPRLEHFVACADMLLKAGCKVDAPDKHSCTPLHIAAGCGSDEILRKFIRLSTDVNAADEIGWTPLFWAASEGHASAVRMLLAKGADPLAEDCNMRLPLHFAAEGGHLACVNALIDAILAGGPKTGGGQSDSGRLAEQAMYVHRPDQNGQAPVNIAAEAHFVDVVAALLDAVPFSNDQLVAGPRDAEAKRRNALHLAAAQGLDDVVPHLLASRRLHPGAKDNDGWMPLHHAAAAGHTTVVGQLLAACWNMEDMMAVNGDTPLHRAALNGHTDCVVEMLKMRCAVDAVNSSGATPLYNAASQGHVNVMRALIEGGANVDAAATNGCTPLYIAANNGFHGE